MAEIYNNIGLYNAETEEDAKKQAVGKVVVENVGRTLAIEPVVVEIALDTPAAWT